MQHTITRRRFDERKKLQNEEIELRTTRNKTSNRRMEGKESAGTRRKGIEENKKLESGGKDNAM